MDRLGRGPKNGQVRSSPDWKRNSLDKDEGQSLATKRSPNAMRSLDQDKVIKHPEMFKTLMKDQVQSPDGNRIDQDSVGSE